MTMGKAKKDESAARRASCYVGWLAGRAALAKRESVRRRLETLRSGDWDKGEYRRVRRELTEELNDATAALEAARLDVIAQNRRVVSALLLAFGMMDMVTTVLDDVADVFETLTIGEMQLHLGGFVGDCRRVAELANKVVVGIDSPGKESLSEAYAEMAEELVDRLKETAAEYIEAYSNTPSGRKYFWGRL